jgi:hypothetical protein
MNEKYIENTNKNSINHNINETSNDSFSNLQKKFEENKRSIKEFECYLRSLLSIAKESQFEYYPQIKSGLEKIKYLVEDNVKCKDLLLKEYEKKTSLEQEEENLNKDIEHNKQILCRNDKGKEVIEKYQLISNISTLSEEIDKYSEINNDEINVLELSKNANGIKRLKNEIEQLRNENELLKNLNNTIEENKVFDKVDEENKGIFSCMNSVKDKYYINFK